jgi:hypothetical protein
MVGLVLQDIDMKYWIIKLTIFIFKIPLEIYFSKLFNNILFQPRVFEYAFAVA